MFGPGFQLHSFECASSMRCIGDLTRVRPTESCPTPERVPSRDGALSPDSSNNVKAPQRELPDEHPAFPDDSRRLFPREDSSQDVTTPEWGRQGNPRFQPLAESGAHHRSIEARSARAPCGISPSGVPLPASAQPIDRFQNTEPSLNFPFYEPCGQLEIRNQFHYPPGRICVHHPQ